MHVQGATRRSPMLGVLDEDFMFGYGLAEENKKFETSYLAIYNASAR